MIGQGIFTKAIGALLGQAQELAVIVRKICLTGRVSTGIDFAGKVSKQAGLAGRIKTSGAISGKITQAIPVSGKIATALNFTARMNLEC